MRSRTTNPYGKTDAQQALIATDLAVVEHMLRAGPTNEIDTRHPLAAVVDEPFRLAF
jgi:hypothetical protein